MAIYQKALAIDPNNANTHEYNGEGYVSVGRFDGRRTGIKGRLPLRATPPDVLS
jgi:hypothetical protein